MRTLPLFGSAIDLDAEEIILALGYITQAVQEGSNEARLKGYLLQHNFTIAEVFGIGYAEPSKLFEQMKKTYDLDFIERNQFCRPLLLANRMTFPHHDEAGEVIGIAGRTLTDASNKYVNSQNSIVFQKSKFLYNLHLINSNSVYVAEGYADVWRALKNVHFIKNAHTCGSVTLFRKIN